MNPTPRSTHPQLHAAIDAVEHQLAGLLARQRLEAPMPPVRFRGAHPTELDLRDPPISLKDEVDAASTSETVTS